MLSHSTVGNKKQGISSSTAYEYTKLCISTRGIVTSTGWKVLVFGFFYSHPYTHKYLGRFPLLMPVGDDLMSSTIKNNW